MGVEKNDNEEFESLLADKRHKEIVGVLRGVATSLNNKKDDGISVAIERQSKLIEQFAESIKKLQAPDVNVSVNQNETTASINEMSKNILKELKELKEMLSAPELKKEWRFKVIRNSTGYIDSVIATLDYNKIKAQA